MLIVNSGRPSLPPHDISAPCTKSLFWAPIYNYLKVPPFNRVQDGTEVTHDKFTSI